jgi:Type II secretion system (T2SS), protein G
MMVQSTARYIFAGVKIVLLCACVFGLTASAKPRSDLAAMQARKLIARMAGFELKTSAVRIKTITSTDSSTAEAAVEIKTAFRLGQDATGQWRVAEFRTGQDRWEQIAFIVRAIKADLNAAACDLPEFAISGSTEPTIKRARCLIANLLGVQLPSDSVRIKDVSPMGLPFSSHPSATVEAVVDAGFRFTRGQNEPWRVAAMRTGNREWTDPDAVLKAVNSEKAANARAELDSIAKALEAFRNKRGFYVESNSESVLIDFLSPTYLARVIRLDPWGRPYQYEGARDHFTLRSVGPDGKENTIDDILLEAPAHSTARR